MEFIDLFAGVGGFHYGIERTNKCGVEGKKRNNQSRIEERQNIEFSEGNIRGIAFDCVWANEWDKYSASVYQRHFKETEFSNADIRTVDVDRIPKFDLLCAGFPCQSFSIAGKRKGFDDTRGTMFFEIARILEAKRPRLALLENVKGLLSHDNGRTFATILDTLSELGYWYEWEVLNSKNFGVPQNRERVFIVGHLGKQGKQKIFPLGENGEVNAGNFRDSKEACAITSTYHKGGKGSMIELTQGNSQGYRVYSSDGISQTLAGEGGGLGAKTGLYAVLTPDREQKRQNGRRFKNDGEEMFTLTGQDVHGNAMHNKIRRLTPIECEMLQGFPKDWTKYGKNGEIMSDTQRYKMMGNAVTTNVITAIAGKIMEVNSE